MKERKKTTLHLVCIFAHVGYSLLAFFHLCLVSVLLSAPFLLEIKFYRNFFSLLSISGLGIFIQECGDYMYYCKTSNRARHLWMD